MADTSGTDQLLRLTRSACSSFARQFDHPELRVLSFSSMLMPRAAGSNRQRLCSALD